VHSEARSTPAPAPDAAAPREVSSKRDSLSEAMAYLAEARQQVCGCAAGLSCLPSPTRLPGVLWWTAAVWVCRAAVSCMPGACQS